MCSPLACTFCFRFNFVREGEKNGRDFMYVYTPVYRLFFCKKKKLVFSTSVEIIKLDEYIYVIISREANDDEHIFPGEAPFSTG